MRHRTSVQTMLTRRAWVAAMLLNCCLAVTITGCSSTTGRTSAATPAATATIAPTPTTAPPPKVVFQADWAHGAGLWKLPPHWTIMNGALVSDGYTTENVPMPYTVTATNYRVEMTVRVVDVTVKRTSYNNYFGILSLDDSGARQYEAESTGFGPLPYHGDTWLTGANGSGNAWESTIGSNARTYRVDVYGKQVVFFPGGTGSIGSVTNAQPNTPAHLYLEASQVKLVITKVVILTI